MKINRRIRLLSTTKTLGPRTLKVFDVDTGEQLTDVTHLEIEFDADEAFAFATMKRDNLVRRNMPLRGDRLLLPAFVFETVILETIDYDIPVPVVEPEVVEELIEALAEE